MYRIEPEPAPPVSELAVKYARGGPRYTSYPTVPQFHRLGDREQKAAYLDTPTNQPLSLYVHIPFCRDICHYCACNKIVTRSAGAARAYLDQLRHEIERVSGFVAERSISQLHWGGGTPTYFNHAEMTELMYELASHFRLQDQPSREYSIELDPRTVDGATIALLKGLGFNRLSMGIQDFDPLVQKSVNRIQSFSLVREMVEEIRHHGFRSLSFDLIYGLPHQDTASMHATLDKVIELSPERIACYNYAHLPEKFPSQRAIDRLCVPDAHQKLELQAIISCRLKKAGYRHIGLDHYAFESDDLAIAQREGRLQRNFQGYSVQMAQDLLGLGVSAISQIGDYYLQNERSLDSYYTRLAQGTTAVSKGLRMSTEDKLRRHVIMQLACNLKLDLKQCDRRFDICFEEHFSAELDELDKMEADKLLQRTQQKIQITEAGRPFLRNICMVFDQYLNNPQTGAIATSFSSTL